MENSSPVSICWMRRDLRLKDNRALCEALRSPYPVLILFIFDRDILDDLEQNDARVGFIYDKVNELKIELEKQGSALMVKEGRPLEIWKTIAEEWIIRRLYYNKDFEPYAKERDQAVTEMLKSRGVDVFSFVDHVIFSGEDVLNQQGEVYKVFTPYSKAWKQKLHEQFGQNGSIELPEHTLQYSRDNYLKIKPLSYPTFKELGFERNAIRIPAADLSASTLKDYALKRDYPAQGATSQAGIHLRFGTLSIREAVRRALDHSETYLDELIWREFYSTILDHFQQVVTESFRPEYDRIEWRNNEEDFRRWCEGSTGFPFVDAGMRQLNQTGYMHNRLRMVTASFLTRDLLIDWRWGEQYFAQKLLDYELSSNNGGWQWAAGTGTDAAPYFRIFNPESQRKRFDPKEEYVRKWVPELDSLDYPEPMLDHKEARERCLRVYKAALGN